jgi:hypothetical protein
MFWQTLQLGKTVLRADHPGMLASMTNLASSLSEQGKYVEAESMLR